MKQIQQVTQVPIWGDCWDFVKYLLERNKTKSGTFKRRRNWLALTIMMMKSLNGTANVKV